MYIAPHHTLEELIKISKQKHSSEIRQRLQILILAKQSRTSESIAHELGYARSTCLSWAKRYNEEQLKGLERRRAKGKEKLLNGEETERLLQRLREGPTPADKVSVFRGEDIRNILEKEFGKVRSLSAIYYLLHSLGYSLLAPRPKHYKSDPNAQEVFKKKFKRKWRGLEKSTLLRQ